jgi:hypothetical protein
MSANLSYDPLANAVPREALGQARQFRNILIAEDARAGAAIQRIMSPLDARLALNRIPRPELLADAAAQWREQLDGPGRLDVSIEHSRTRLTIRELRISAADARLDEWTPGEVEPGIAILVLSTEIHRRKDRSVRALLAGISLHAAARWFQRAWVNTADALRADILAFARAIDDVDLSTGRFSVPVASGRWAGIGLRIIEAGQPAVVLSARTFLTD